MGHTLGPRRSWSSSQTQCDLWDEEDLGCGPHQDKEPEADSAFPMLLPLFGKEVAAVVLPIALGHFSPLLPMW